MSPRIETLPEKKLIGINTTMSLVNNTTGALWGSFMPRRKEIIDTQSNDLYSLQVYPPDYYTRFNAATPFQKWAAVEVNGHGKLPTEMQAFTLEGGLYAVFDYKGPAGDPAIFQYIFGTWLPGSSYELDSRPHFEVLGSKYSNTDPRSEEEIWIPVRHRTPAS